GFSHPLSLQTLSADYPSLIIPSQSGKRNGGILIARQAKRKGQVVAENLAQGDRVFRAFRGTRSR
ncbi:MAG: hypothetical protein WBZ67_10540, partial [Pseudolabrys sp.]